MDRLVDQRENTEVICDTILQTLGVSNQQQYNMNMMTTKLVLTNFYLPPCHTPYYPPKTHDHADQHHTKHPSDTEH